MFIFLFENEVEIKNSLKLIDMKIHTFLVLIFLFLGDFLSANIIANRLFNLESYSPHADGLTDDTPAFLKLFKDVEESGGGVITIPPKDYYFSGEMSIPVTSNTEVFAYGARFFLPEILGDKARLVLFDGVDISNFKWSGGFFKGYCFDPGYKNTWEPNVNTRIFVINTSEVGITTNITFRDISSEKIAGAVVNVNGYSEERDFLDINFATNITVENCNLINSGRFMWDYGYLWQIVVFPEDHTTEELGMAYKYFDNDLIISDIRISEKDNRIYFNNVVSEMDESLLMSEDQDICFFNDTLPDNLIRGKMYFVVEASKSYIKISETKGGNPIVFGSTGGYKIKLMNKVSRVARQWEPTGSGPGKGAIDVNKCKNTIITGCQISSLGDAMHIHACHDNIFTNNHILSARMGAFFLAEYCKNSTISNNIVDGNNGSRICSIEKSNENVTMTGNIFKNGGRGCWINQPKNLIIQNNFFLNNTLKGTENSAKGRRSYRTGGWQNFAEMYFTTYEKNGEYGSVIIKDNVFNTGNEAPAAIQFESNGSNIQMDGNIFQGHTGGVWMEDNVSSIIIGNNPGIEVKKGKEYSKSLFSNTGM